MWTGDNRRAQEDEKKTAETEVGQLQGKGKAFPLQAWTCLLGSMRFKLPDFYTIDT